MPIFLHFREFKFKFTKMRGYWITAKADFKASDEICLEIIIIYSEITHLHATSDSFLSV